MIWAASPGPTIETSTKEATMTTMTHSVYETSAHTEVTAPPAATTSKKAIWTGRTMSAMAALFLTFDATIHVIAPPVVTEGMAKLGYPPGVAVWLGVIQVACLALYLVPRTAAIGAVLWTGYLGGAIATHVRVGDPLFSHVLFPIYVAILLWGGLYLRDPRVRALVRR
jgi:hypothetical protein